MTLSAMGKNPCVGSAHSPLVFSESILLRSSSITSQGKVGKNPLKNGNSVFSVKLAVEGIPFPA